MTTSGSSLAKSQGNGKKVDEYQEFCTKDANGNTISEEEARVKYIKLLKKYQERCAGDAARFVFSQLAILCVCIVLGLLSNSFKIPFLFGGPLIGLLIFYTLSSLKRSSAYKKLIIRVQSGEINAIKQLQGIEERYAKRLENMNREQ